MDELKRLSLRAPFQRNLSKDAASHINKLTQYLESESDAFEAIAQVRDIDGSMIDRALELVKDLIIKKQLILYGGTAIDYALRLKGSFLYPEEKRPDLDFYSDNSIGEAFALVEEFQRMGFINVYAIRSIHVQTTKVHVNFIPVADIGFVPKAVYDDIPTLTYNQMRIVHPHYQMMDMHLAMSFPFAGAPREDVFHRWAKDLKRYNMLLSHYPIPEMPASTPRRIKLNLLSELGKTAALNGFAGYAALCHAYAELREKIGNDSASNILVPFLKITNNEIEYDSPIDELTIATPWPDKYINNTDDTEHFAPYMDVYPESYKIKGVTVMSVKNRLLSVSNILINKIPIYVASPQYILLYFLSCYFRTKKEPYLEYYSKTLALIKAAEMIYATLKSDNDLKVTAFSESPFVPSLNVIGDSNYSMATLIVTARNNLKLGKATEEDKELLFNLPNNYYPKGDSIAPEFTYSNKIYVRSGEKLPHFG